MSFPKGSKGQSKGRDVGQFAGGVATEYDPQRPIAVQTTGIGTSVLVLVRDTLRNTFEAQSTVFQEMKRGQGAASPGPTSL